MDHDVIVLGGSYAGLSAALQLARARRRVLVVDSGQRRNAPAAHAHGFLTRDGESPARIAELGKEQLLRYPTVTWLDAEATSATRTDDGFAIEVRDHSPLHASRLVLAMGIRDQLPALPGLRERWGRHVFHCPYCHGYELHGGPIGLLATSPLAFHLAALLPDWGPTTIFLQEGVEPDDEQARLLDARGVRVERTPVEAFAQPDSADLRLADGRIVTLDGLFVPTRGAQSSPIPGMLGCAFDDTPVGDIIRVDMMGATSVPGVFAGGDAARAGGSLAFAVADGVRAGVAAHRSLIFGTEGATS